MSHELLQHIPNLRYVSGTEYKGPCPLCKEGHDRFCLWTDGGIENTGRYYCRVCGKKGNAVGLLCELGMSEAATRVVLRLDSIEDWKKRPWALGTEAGRWTYRDKSGKPLYESVRYEPPNDHPLAGKDKTFLPYKSGVRRAGLGDVRRVPYLLPELLKGAAEGCSVIHVEGERHAEKLSSIGFVTSTTVSGSSGWRDEYADHYIGASVVAVLADNDEPGRRYARDVAKSMQRRKIPVKLVELPGLSKGGDVLDWLAAGGTANELRAIIQDTPHAEPIGDDPVLQRSATSAESGAFQSSQDEKKKTHAEILLEIADASELFHTPDGDSYASYPIVGGIKTSPIDGRDFRDWLRSQFYAREGKPPAAQTLRNVVDMFVAKANYMGEKVDVYLRIAGHDGRIYVDLCNDNFEIVEVTAEGWSVTSDAPVKFRRTRGMTALPRPENGGTLQLLRSHVRTSDVILLWAWLVGAAQPSGPYPVLVLLGEQGTGKSFLARLLRKMIDPSTVPIRAQPREERDLVIAAHNGWMLAFDNLSGLRDWLSDALCRISTGGGFGTRRLYENREEEIFYQQRPILVNGIEDIATRPDLADRAVTIELEMIPEDERKTESQLWEAFNRDHPRLLGALFDAVSSGLANVETVRFDRLPRMADFATRAEAALPECGFLEAYEKNRHAAIEITVASDSVASAVLSLLDENDSNGWEGTTSELMEVLRMYLPDPNKLPKDYPSTIQAMTARLRRIMPALRAVGIQRRELSRTPGKRARIFRLESNRKNTSTTSTTSKTNDKAPEQGYSSDELGTRPDAEGQARPETRPGGNGLNGSSGHDSERVDVSDVTKQLFSNHDDWSEEMTLLADEADTF